MFSLPLRSFSFRFSAPLRACTPRLGVMALGGALAAFASMGPAHAAEDALKNATPWPLNDADPVSSVPSLEEANKNPMGYGYFLMGLTDIAVEAEEARDWAKAKRYYQALIKGAPGRAVGYQKVCEMDRNLKDYPSALDSCFAVLSRKGVEVDDFSKYVQLISQVPLELGLANKDRALDAMDHFQKAHPLMAMRGRCLIGTRFMDQALMELCVPVILEAEKDKPSVQALSFAWQLDVLRQDWDAAQARVDEIATRPDANPEVVRPMQQLVADEKAKKSASRWTWVRRAFLGLGVLGLVWWWRRKDKA